MNMETVNSAAETASASRRSFGRVTLIVLAFCLVAATAEGYDSGVFGVVLPSLLHYRPWGLNPADVGLIASLAPAGMVVGSLTVGTLTDVLGRRKTIIACLAAYSILTALCALAPNPDLFGLLRFLSGLGLGGVIPTAAALTGEYAPVRVRNLAYMVVFSGFPLGGVLGALIGKSVIPAWGWQPMFALALLPLIVVVPLALRYLPESVRYLLLNGRRGEAERTAARFGLGIAEIEAGEPVTQPAEQDKLATVKTLVSRPYRFATIIFWATYFLSLVATWSIITWLPQLMRQAGYDLGSALTFLLVFNIGAIIGTVGIATVADKMGSKPVTIATFLAGAASVALLTVRMPIGVSYVIVCIAGAAIISITGLLNAYVSKHYPAHVVATALGWGLGVGRVGGIVAPYTIGLLVGSGLSVNWDFFAIASTALVAAALTALVPKSPARLTQPAATAQSVAQWQ
jgi:MFS transporter, AAHS family, benzoate transport protein